MDRLMLTLVALFACILVASSQTPAENRCSYCESVDLDCGPDGIGGSCGTCPVGQRCDRGRCVCDRDCTARQCGPDNCGTDCGECLAGQTCSNGICVGDCTPQCTRTVNGAAKLCGWDRCGGDCGSCPDPFRCKDGECLCYPDCTDKNCGPDGCGGTCGECVGEAGRDYVCGDESDEYPGVCHEVCFKCGDGICDENESADSLNAILNGKEWCVLDCGSVTGVISLAVGQKDQLNDIQIDFFDVNPYTEGDRELAGRAAETRFSDDKGSFSIYNIDLPGEPGSTKRVYFRLRGETSDRTTGDPLPLMDLWWNFELEATEEGNRSPNFYFFMTPFFTDSDALFRLILSWGNLLEDRSATIPDVDMFIAGPVDEDTMEADNEAFRNGIVNFQNKDYKSETANSILPFAKVVADSAQGFGPEVIDVLKDTRIGAPEQVIGLSRDYPEIANGVNRLEVWVDRPNSNSNSDNAFTTLAETNSFIVIYRGASVNPTVINEQLFFGDYQETPAYQFGFANKDDFNQIPSEAAAWHVFNIAYSLYSDSDEAESVSTVNVFEFQDFDEKYPVDDFIFAPTKTIPCGHSIENGVPPEFAYCPYTIEYPVRKK